jgi:hypothetical protein
VLAFGFCGVAFVASSIERVAASTFTVGTGGGATVASACFAPAAEAWAAAAFARVGSALADAGVTDV